MRLSNSYDLLLSYERQEGRDKMKLGILDQSPIASGQSAQEALQASLQLAQEGDRLGYSRIWFTEHHDLPGLACSVPEVLISYIAAQTKNIELDLGQCSSAL